MALHENNWCDRCPSRAYARATMYSGLELFFCAHHLTQYRVALDAQTLALHDETELLTTHITDDKHVV